MGLKPTSGTDVIKSSFSMSQTIPNISDYKRTFCSPHSFAFWPEFSWVVPLLDSPQV